MFLASEGNAMHRFASVYSNGFHWFGRASKGNEQSLAWWSLRGIFFHWSGFYEVNSLARLPHIFAYPTPYWVLATSRNKCGAILTPSLPCGKYTRGIFFGTHTTFMPRGWAMTVFSLPEFYYILRVLPTLCSKYEAYE